VYFPRLKKIIESGLKGKVFGVIGGGANVLRNRRLYPKLLSDVAKTDFSPERLNARISHKF
jgi:hypothetical protein